MIHDNEAKSPSFLIPPSRHRHSCVLFDEGLWVYGGMTDLQERSDLWRLDLSKSCFFLLISVQHVSSAACTRPNDVVLHADLTAHISQSANDGV